VIGTNDRVTISNWYLNNSYQLDYILAGASILSNDEIDQLVLAMSQYTAPEGADNFVPQDVMDELQPVLTEVWLSLILKFPVWPEKDDFFNRIICGKQFTLPHEGH
jgi:Haemolysin-type calcium binding protein related domain